MVGQIIAFLILAAVKIFSHLFYKLELTWVSPVENPWTDIRLIALLNHTSLYEPLYCQALPYSFLWTFAGNMAAPAADKTFDRPIVGRFWKLMMPKATTITRKRDNSWTQFMETLGPESIVIIAPEGRMKRPHGLDAYGKPMNIKSGIADILEKLDQGRLAICYSGGLHHVQSPGETFPRLFKTIKIALEIVDIRDYKKGLDKNTALFREAVVHDLEARLKQHCPT